MNIIFLWDSDLNITNDTGIMLSGKYFISYDRKTRELFISRNENYVDGFWGKQVRDCLAIVGENGSGKTILANCIMEDINIINSGADSQKDFLVIGENENNSTLSIYYTTKFGEPEFKEQHGIKYELCLVKNNNCLERFEVAYFQNQFNYYDYMAQNRCRYDFSLGHIMRHHREITFEMHYDSLEKDAIRNYYNNEISRIIPFLYDDTVKNKIKMNFPMPAAIQISIADKYYNNQYLINETKKLKAYEEGKVPKDIVKKFSNNVNNLEKASGKIWTNHTVKNLILNCYKELCIPATVPSRNMVSPYVFFDACKFLEQIESNELSIYKCAFKITKKLRQKLRDDEYKWCIDCIDCIEKFVTWLEKNKTIINKYGDNIMQQLVIPTDDDTKAFITDLIKLYSDMNFAFPFYEFSFGVSTGEFYFLSLFSNLYSMVKKDTSFKNVYDYTKLEDKKKNILLIFDEADLSMHPRWQRIFMKWLTDFCNQLFQNVSVKIIITTHSPVLLSDFPANSILYLTKSEEKKTNYSQSSKETFGSNIHSLYLNAFFLEDHGTMGAFAEEKINEIADKLLQESIAEIDHERIEKEIRYLGEGIIRDKLEEALNNKSRKKINQMNDAEKMVISDTLAKLKEQRNYMDQLIRELEEKVDDKN